jgi:hypothetical protein
MLDGSKTDKEMPTEQKGLEEEEVIDGEGRRRMNLKRF